MTATIERTLEFKAPIDRVWKALSDAESLAAWFPNAGAHFEPVVGFVGWLAWDLEECTGRYALQVEEVDAPHRIAWRWAREADTPIEEAHTTLVEWTLESLANGGTKLHMLESGFVRDADRAENVAGWQQELGELVEYIGE